jgi:hypothetical protein
MACENVGIANIYTDLTCSSALKMRIAAFCRPVNFNPYFLPPGLHRVASSRATMMYKT